jgi:hypothetical protein
VPPPTVWELWRVRWRMITAMFMIYVITLCIFPGFLAEDVKVRDEESTSCAFVCTVCVLIVFLCLQAYALPGVGAACSPVSPVPGQDQNAPHAGFLSLPLPLAHDWAEHYCCCAPPHRTSSSARGTLSSCSWCG